MNVYVLDSVFAVSILVATVLTVSVLGVLSTQLSLPPEKELAVLLSEPGFVSAVYLGDEKTVIAYLNSFLDRPYNFTVYYNDGRVFFTVGVDVEGVSAVAVLPGWNGSLKPLIVSLRVGG